ncbi:MAG TPA: hypothetical protein VL326_08625 [Kofleriaceae bacterium]|nr:hypothetical protein [Kofleriaceae bacterium]
MRIALAIIALAGCDGNANGTVPSDAPADAGYGSGSGPCTPPEPLCTSTPFCNHNNAIESCYVQPMPGHCYYQPGGQERCDGTAVPSCTSLGYLGGTTTCTDCEIDTTGCTVCDASTLGCVGVPGFVLDHGLAVSGSYVAFGSDASVAITNGLTLVATPAVADVRALVGVPGGWLVATDSPPALSTLDTTGVRGALQPLPSGATAPVLAYGAGGRVLVAWTEAVGTGWHVKAAIADASGAIVVPTFDVLVTDGSGIEATCDGTSFFLGGYGQLAHIASDGQLTVAAGFPRTGPHVDLSWRNTTGWYVSWDVGNAYFRSQRFDSSGALVGGMRDIAGAFGERDFIGDGDDLLTAERGSQHLGDPQTVYALRHPLVGLSVLEGTAGAGPVLTTVRGAFLGNQLLVAWQVPGAMQLALLP